MKKIKEIIFKEYEFSKYQKLMLIMLIFVIGGIFGFIYETFFYRIDLGYFVKRGTTYGPWIPIYAFGGVGIFACTYKMKKKPYLILLLSILISGILEYCTGYFLFYNKGIRLWDYNTEIWNFGNIDGFICLRSVLFFGISGLFLTYLIIPFLKFLINKLNKILISIISIIPFLMFVFDIVYSNLVK